MSRIVRTGDTPAKRRNAHRRSCAEVLRLLAEKTAFDDEAKDMAAFLVFNLRGIGETIEQSAFAWDDRNYWKKAEALRHKWLWTSKKAEEIGQIVVQGKWQLFPPANHGIVSSFFGC